MMKTIFSLLVILSCASSAYAAPILLSDQNSTFTLDPTSPATPSTAGAFSWEVDGTEHLFREWFWYRALFMGRERTIDRTATNAPAAYTAVSFDSADADAAHDVLVVTYSHPISSTDATVAFTIQVEYDLDGAPDNSGLSSVAETITVTNYLAGNLTFNLFEYSDFSVNGTANDDTATLVNPSTITQTDASGGSATVTVTQPVPAHYEIAPVPTILTKLNNSSSTTLNDTTTNVAGGTNMAFAFQWSEIIDPVGPNNTWVIEKQKAISGLMTPVPEPGSLLLVGSGLFGLQQWRRRRQLKRGGSASVS